MSQDVIVLAEATNLPSAEQWAEEVKQEGFDLNLDKSFDTRQSSGFRPCPDSKHGFEYTVGELSSSDIECFEFSPQQRVRIKSFDSIVGLHYKTEADLEVVKVASAVLAKLTNGIAIESESGAAMTPQETLAWARGEFEPQLSVSARKPTSKQGLSFITLVKIILIALIASYWLFRWAMTP